MTAGAVRFSCRKPSERRLFSLSCVFNESACHPRRDPDSRNRQCLDRRVAASNRGARRRRWRQLATSPEPGGRRLAGHRLHAPLAGGVRKRRQAGGVVRGAAVRPGAVLPAGQGRALASRTRASRCAGSGSCASRRAFASTWTGASAESRRGPRPRPRPYACACASRRLGGADRRQRALLRRRHPDRIRLHRRPAARPGRGGGRAGARGAASHRRPGGAAAQLAQFACRAPEGVAGRHHDRARRPGRLLAGRLAARLAALLPGAGIEQLRVCRAGRPDPAAAKAPFCAADRAAGGMARDRHPAGFGGERRRAFGSRPFARCRASSCARWPRARIGSHQGLTLAAAQPGLVKLQRLTHTSVRNSQRKIHETRHATSRHRSCQRCIRAGPRHRRSG
ncbi:hypothetical protein VARIO8X_100270 [Burkholderiales bacterium 8X]|nr:hypothetical protein VARIO8X_100270 [Burkholderiales bacterium 8X]